uniref:Uncharacterized protein n=1 Tax=Anguilla anguilla TaxID=7936 RepID=A0A0E9W8Q9_ANGAN
MILCVLIIYRLENKTRRCIFVSSNVFSHVVCCKAEMYVRDGVVTITLINVPVSCFFIDKII